MSDTTITCPGCGSAVPEGLSECPHCNEMLAGLEPDRPPPRTVLPLIGAGLSLLIALGWGIIALMQLAAASVQIEGVSALTGVWNLAICAVLIAGSVGLFMRKKWGHGICLWTAVLNALLGAYQVYTGAWLVAPIVLLSVVVAVLLFMAWKEFQVTA